MAQHNDLGKKGEKQAICYLKNQGYTIFDTNWRFQHLELDIIALKENTLCFVEVKTRRNKLYGEPYQALTKIKQKNIICAANQYIQINNIDYDIRFDLITIISSTAEAELIHYKNVFIPFSF